jgi:lipopolysaccharide export system permease protein
VLTLDTYIASRLLSPFIQGVAMFWGLLLALDTVRRALDFYEGGATPFAALQFFLFSSPQYLALSLPMAMLFAGIYTFGELSSQNEITAFTSAGVPFRRLVAPALGFAIGASLFSFFVSEAIAPWCNHQVAELEARVAPGVGSHGASNRIWRDIDQHGRVNMIVFASEFSADPPALRDLTILRYEYGSDDTVDEVLLTRAQEATYDSHYWWTLRGAWTRQTMAPRPLEWEEGRINLYRPPAQIARLDLEARTLTIGMLRDDLAELAAVLDKSGGGDSEAERKYYSYATELALRFSVPLACLVFAMAGCPMGIRPERSGRSLSYGLSFAIIMLYYVFLHYMTRLGYQGVVPGWVAAWVANVVVAAVGAVLIFRVPQ